MMTSDGSAAKQTNNTKRRNESAKRRRETWIRDLDKPRRYLVISRGEFYQVHRDSPRDALEGCPTGSRAVLMGTHETEAQVRFRLGFGRLGFVGARG